MNKSSLAGVRLKQSLDSKYNSMSLIKIKKIGGLNCSCVPGSSLFDAGPAGSQWTWRQEEQQRQEESPVTADQQPQEQLQQEENGRDGADSGGGGAYWANQNPREGVARLR